MTELPPGADRPPWRAGACARTPADEKVSLPRELERQKRVLERAYCDLARPRWEPTADRHASGGHARLRRGSAATAAPRGRSQLPPAAQVALPARAPERPRPPGPLPADPERSVLLLRRPAYLALVSRRHRAPATRRARPPHGRALGRRWYARVGPWSELLEADLSVHSRMEQPEARGPAPGI